MSDKKIYEYILIQDNVGKDEQVICLRTLYENILWKIHVRSTDVYQSKYSMSELVNSLKSSQEGSAIKSTLRSPVGLSGEFFWCIGKNCK